MSKRQGFPDTGEDLVTLTSLVLFLPEAGMTQTDATIITRCAPNPCLLPRNPGCCSVSHFSQACPVQLTLAGLG